MSLETDIGNLPFPGKMEAREDEFATQLVERMQRELGENYLPTAGLLAGNMLLILSRRAFNRAYEPADAPVFQKADYSVTPATAGWWNEIKDQVLAFCDQGNEAQIARVLARLCEKMANTIFSAVCSPS